MDIHNANDKYYDGLYVENPNIWGTLPCITLEKTWESFDRNKLLLDLGCGQGRNALFMASRGFSVEAVDASAEAIEQLRAESIKRDLNISTRCAEILDYPISEKYSVILLINVISFWKRKSGLEYLESLKKSVGIGVCIVVTGLLQEDEFFKDNPDGLFFETGELKQLFSGFEYLFYQEDSFIEGPHEGYPYPHKHAFARIVAKKIR